MLISIGVSLVIELMTPGLPHIFTLKIKYFSNDSINKKDSQHLIATKNIDMDKHIFSDEHILQ